MKRKKFKESENAITEKSNDQRMNRCRRGKSKQKPRLTRKRMVVKQEETKNFKTRKNGKTRRKKLYKRQERIEFFCTKKIKSIFEMRRKVRMKSLISNQYYEGKTKSRLAKDYTVNFTLCIAISFCRAFFSTKNAQLSVKWCFFDQEKFINKQTGNK